MTYNLLQGKKGIIFGALDQNSIAWKVAEKCRQEGAEFLLTNAPVALRMGAINELAASCDTEVIAADATDMNDLSNLFDKALEKYNKLDFIL
ncbi:MAG: SDR family oxidoreductase, partial [Flavobacteriales bacterium]|nr:SDR family oxidoreductase [Flavobacteriales bacterium]